MEPIGEIIQDRFLIRAVNLLRFEASVRRKVILLLKKLESDLAAEVSRHDPTGTVRTAYQQARLTALLRQTRATLGTAYSEINATVQKDMRAIAASESVFVLGVINAPVGIELASVAVAPEVLRVVARDTLIQGNAASVWWSRQAGTLQQRFADAMRQGILRSETNGQLVARVRGTKAKNYSDAIMQMSRSSAERLVRSQVQAVLNESRLETYRSNSDVIRELLWSAHFDNRTSIWCLARHRKRYTLDLKPIGHNIPWLEGPGRIHWNCRSHSIPVLASWESLSRTDAMITGGRPTSISRYFEERLRQKGLSEEQVKAAKLNVRASMDGEVPANISFHQWLKQKERTTPHFADELLGKTRASLWRKGVISLEDLLDFKGNPLPVEVLLQEAA